MRKSTWVICLIWLSLLQSQLVAQKTFNQFYELDNLQSKELIKSISKDDRGFIWVATDEGVLRYDGNETLLFFKELPTPYTKEFLITQDGRFLVLHDAGLVEIVNDQDSIYIIPFKTGDFTFREKLIYPKSIYEDKNGTIWIGEINSIVRINEDGFKRYNLGQEFRSISYHHTFAFEEDAFGNLWIAPFKGVLLTYDEGDDAMKRMDLSYPITEVSSMVNVKGDHLLISGREGLVQIKIDSDQNILEYKFYPQVKNISVLEAIDEEIYVGTWESGMYHATFNSQSLQFENLSIVPIIDIIDFYYGEKDGELWIAGSENIGVLKTTLINHIEVAGSNRIESITIDQSGGFYYSIGQQVFYLDPSFQHEAREVFYLDNSYFSKILFDEDQLWVGDAFGMVFYYDLNSGQRSNLVTNVNVSINQILQDSKGRKWFTGNTNGLIKVEKDNSVKFYSELDTTWAMVETAEGVLYCGSNSRDSLLHVYDENNDSFILVDLQYNFKTSGRFLLNDMVLDPSGNLWAASSYGLLKIPNENGEFKQIERVEIQGFDINEPVRAVAISGDKMWIANNYGLVLASDDNVLVFNKDSGLPSRIIKNGGLDFLKENQLFISTAKGLGVVDESDLEIKKSDLPIFKLIRINSRLVNPEINEKLELPYKSKVEVEFISLSFPGISLEYQTRILGMDSQWSKPSSNRNLSVLGFSEGDYTIEVRARESGFTWSDPVSFSFTIRQPWFKSWWAIGSFIALALIVIYVSVKIHNRNLIAQKKNLQRIIEERTGEINKQKNEIIEQQEKIIKQKEELIEKNQAILRSQQALHDADMNYLHLKEKQLEEQIEHKNKQITTHTLNIIQKNETLKDLSEQLESLIKKSDAKSAPELKKTLKIIDESFRLDKDWEDFKLYFEQVYTGFYAKLQVNYHDITTHELRHCALIRLNLTIQECASILGISPESVKVSRTRLRKKLNLPKDQSLSDFIMGL